MSDRDSLWLAVIGMKTQMGGLAEQVVYHLFNTCLTFFFCFLRPGRVGKGGTVTVQHSADNQFCEEHTNPFHGNSQCPPTLCLII